MTEVTNTWLQKFNVNKHKFNELTKVLIDVKLFAKALGTLMKEFDFLLKEFEGRKEELKDIQQDDHNYEIRIS